jgi:hypothetical protein
MPTMADISVFKNDGTTNIVYVAKSPSAGDSVPAAWRSDAAAAAYAGLKPELRMVTKWNGARTARRCDITGVYPSTVVNTTTGVTESIGKVVFEASFAIPQMVPQADIDEAVSQLSNLLSSSLIRTSLKAGFAPT